MAEKVKTMLKNNMVLCVLILTGIGLISVIFAADFTIKEGALEEGVVFGSWTSTDSNGNSLTYDIDYQATSDGFVVARCYKDGGYTAKIGAYTSSDISNQTERLSTSSEEDAKTQHVCVTLPVKKNDYWTLDMGTPAGYSIYWIPLGNGGAPVKQ